MRSNTRDSVRSALTGAGDIGRPSKPWSRAWVTPERERAGQCKQNEMNIRMKQGARWMMRHFTPSISNDIPSMESGMTSLNPTRKYKSYFYVLPNPIKQRPQVSCLLGGGKGTTIPPRYNRNSNGDTRGGWSCRTRLGPCVASTAQTGR